MEGLYGPQADNTSSEVKQTQMNVRQYLVLHARSCTVNVL